jgi:hypothetical protein
MANTDYGNGFKVASAATTQGPFSLLGGKYGVTVSGTFGGGSVALQTLGPDGSTYVTNTAASFTANGYAAVDLPPGKVQLAIATATAVFASVIPISNRR